MSNARPSLLSLALVCGALTVLFPTGCQVSSIDRETGELYHHNWWNHYQRGLQLLQDGKVEEAKADFEICLGLKRGAKFGYDEELWRARTYGLHFLEGYFPNRELGICHYQLGQTEEAEHFLARSLEKESSGRAKHFLNLARARSLEGRRVVPPQVGFDPECEVVWTRERRRSVSGVARGEGFVREVEVGGRRQFIELADKRMRFEASVAMRPGTNVVAVIAEDLARQRSTSRVTWIADWRPPQLVVTGLRRDGGDWVVDGVCADDCGVGSVELDGSGIYKRVGDPLKRRVPVTLRFATGRRPVLTVEDIAGNRTETVVDTDSLVTGARVGVDRRLASTIPDLVPLPERHPLLIVQAGRAAAGDDKEEPSLSLPGVEGLTRVFDEEFFLNGIAGDSGGLASISVNGEEVLAREDRGAIRAYFSRRLPVDHGTNHLDVVARDMQGNRHVRKVAVLRQDPEYRNVEFRLAMVVPPVPSDEPEEVKRELAAVLQGELLRDPPRFHLLERGEGWDYVLRELKLSASDLSDTRAALRIGRLLPADLFMLTTLMRHRTGVTLYARIVDAEAGDVLFNADVYSDSSHNDLPYQVGGLVMKVEQRFPLVSADIVEVSGSKATVSVGARDGARSGTRFIVVRGAEGGTPRGAGKVREMGGRSVELKIKRLRPDTGIAEISPAGARDAVKEGDYAYAR